MTQKEPSKRRDTKVLWCVNQVLIQSQEYHEDLIIGLRGNTGSSDYTTSKTDDGGGRAGAGGRDN